MKPYRFLNGARTGADKRIVYYSHCPQHPCIDKIRWPDGSEECMMCAGERQIALMTAEQRKNVGFNLPYIENWKPRESVNMKTMINNHKNRMLITLFGFAFGWLMYLITSSPIAFLFGLIGPATSLAMLWSHKSNTGGDDEQGV